MKVFEVITERCESDNKKITETVQYVTSAKNTFLSVADYFTTYCDEYGVDLKSIKEVMNIVQHIV